MYHIVHNVPDKDLVGQLNIVGVGVEDLERRVVHAIVDDDQVGFQIHGEHLTELGMEKTHDIKGGRGFVFYLQRRLVKRKLRDRVACTMSKFCGLVTRSC